MIKAGDQVDHDDFGIGTVISRHEKTAEVEFFGEIIDVKIEDLSYSYKKNNQFSGSASIEKHGRRVFRQSFESMNMGVVPSDPEQLIKLTINGEKISANMHSILNDAPRNGASRIFMGYYGSGKSHHLKLVRAIALHEGWVTASIELDPKSADPAKPFSVYQDLVTGLEFPRRSDGLRNVDFFDLIKEIRDKWTDVRSSKYLKASPWFMNGIEALRFFAHRRDDPAYASAVNWLAGQVKLIRTIRKLAWREGYRANIPAMPQNKDNGLIYVFHLVVIHEILKKLGYKGLALIIDEAEHVRNYQKDRYIKANNFFDILARCAHPARDDLQDPSCDYDVSELPAFWKEGPHFSLFVGLTEGEDTQDLDRKAGEMSVLIHSPDDVVRLTPPSPEEYEEWVVRFLTEASINLGSKVDLLSNPAFCTQIASLVRERFERTPDTEKILRNWTKMAGLPVAVLLSQTEDIGHNSLLAIIDNAAKQISEEVMPWDD